jgi:hypothetical protein
VEKKHCGPYQDSNSNPSFAQPVASRYTDCPMPVPDEGIQALETNDFHMPGKVTSVANLRRVCECLLFASSKLCDPLLEFV